MTKFLNLNVQIRVIPAHRQVLLICVIHDKQKAERYIAQPRVLLNVLTKII